MFSGEFGRGSNGESRRADINTDGGGGWAGIVQMT